MHFWKGKRGFDLSNEKFAHLGAGAELKFSDELPDKPNKGHYFKAVKPKQITGDSKFAREHQGMQIAICFQICKTIIELNGTDGAAFMRVL